MYVYVFIIFLKIQKQGKTITMASNNKIVTSALRAAVNLRSSKIPTQLLKSSHALLSSAPAGGKHTLPGLDYDYGALERK